MNNSPNIRVRFAPSPTGFLHVGGLRTALYNYFFAKKHHGVFVLRIEDTDRTRYVEGAIKNLIESLKWAGLEYDEGPAKGGALGPYVQSERLNIYREHAEHLLTTKKAYRCFCTTERLEQMRKKQEKMRIPAKYDRQCLRLSAKEIEDNLTSGTPYVIRMKVPEGITIFCDDIIRGKVEFQSDQIDDQILMKSDGYPTYHLANVVDDHLMKISHVIRGEEWLSSTPKHVLLYEYFEWDMPRFAHLPLLLNTDKSKLSKRQGDVAVEDYRAKGYLSEALVNFVAFLGWNPGDEREIFAMDDLVKEFSLERVGKSGAVFNIEKLNWLNFEHLRRKQDHEILSLLKEELAHSHYAQTVFKDEYLLKVVSALRERVSFAREFIDKGSYFFDSSITYDPALIKKRWKKSTHTYLVRLAEEFASLQNPTKDDFETTLQGIASAVNVEKGELIHAVRLAVSGVGTGPGLYDILDILGRDESVRRIRTAIDSIKNPA